MTLHAVYLVELHMGLWRCQFMCGTASRENGILAISCSSSSWSFNNLKVNKSVRFTWVARITIIWVWHKVGRSCVTHQFDLKVVTLLVITVCCGSIRISTCRILVGPWQVSFQSSSSSSQKKFDLLTYMGSSGLRVIPFTKFGLNAQWPKIV